MLQEFPMIRKYTRHGKIRRRPVRPKVDALERCSLGKTNNWQTNHNNKYTFSHSHKVRHANPMRSDVCIYAVEQKQYHFNYMCFARIIELRGINYD